MKTIQLILFCALVCCLNACSDEDKIHASVGDSWYNLEDDPSDPVQHYIYEFYKTYQTIIVKDPDIRDYRYNFKKKNNIRVVSPLQEKELLEKGLSLVKEVFVDVYTEGFLKEYLPHSVIMADSIFFLGMEDQTPSYHAFVSTNYVAIAGIRPEMDSYTDADIREIRGEVNGKFWKDYLLAIKGVFQVPEEFYEVSEEYYKQSDWDWDVETPEDVDWHEMGFVSYDPGMTNFDPDPDWGGWWIQAPSKDIDISQWLEFVFRVTKTERDAIFEAYPLMKKKYDILKEAMKQCGEFDISSLQ